MREELQRVDPLGFSISREEFLVESYVLFSVDASCGLAWGPLDGAVNGFVLEVFVDIAAVAGDAGFWAPAVNVSTEGSEGSGKRYIEGWEMHSCGERREPLYGHKMFKFADSGIGAAFGGNTEKTQASVIFG